MSSNKKSLLKTVLTANGSCGCGKSKPSDVIEPTPKPKISVYQNETNPSISMTSSSTTSSGEDFTSTTVSEEAAEIAHDDHNNYKSPKISIGSIIPKQSPKLMDSIAVEKNSADPYQDFRHSMLQMIFEKEIESDADLQDLLQCFLQLNAPSHHQVIVQAFSEICKESFPNKVSTQPSSSRRNHAIQKSK